MIHSRKQRQQLVDSWCDAKGITPADPNLITGQKLCNELSKLSFCCDDSTLHQRKPDTYQDEKCCLTHTVGLPTHPATGEPMFLTPYQLKFVNHVINATKSPTVQQFKKKFKIALKKFLRTPHFFHINKGRQMGFTEILLRLIQYFCFSRYAGYNVGIMAGTNGNLAKKDLRRFARLFKSISIVVSQWIKSNVMELVNGTHIEAFPASEEAMTGLERYKCIFEDENAKWRMVDDSPVFDSIVPIIESSGGDLFLVSTPKGPLKMFYKIHEDPGLIPSRAVPFTDTEFLSKLGGILSW